jgi:hypothetical protein
MAVPMPIGEILAVLMINLGLKTLASCRLQVSRCMRRETRVECEDRERRKEDAPAGSGFTVCTHSVLMRVL